MKRFNRNHEGFSWQNLRGDILSRPTSRASSRTAVPAGQPGRPDAASRGHPTQPTGNETFPQSPSERDTAASGGVRHPTKFKNGLRTV